MGVQRHKVNALLVVISALVSLALRVAVVTLACIVIASLDPPSIDAQSPNDSIVRIQSTRAGGSAEVGARCVSCHRAYVDMSLSETHGKTAKFLNDSRAASCETCHGNGDKHIDNREKRIAAEDIENPTELRNPDERRRASASCLQCHSGDRGHFNWQGSEHDRSDMSCMSCHNVHHAKLPGWALAARSRALIDGPSLDSTDIKFPEKMLASFTVEETCLRCHTDKRKAMFQRSTHLFRTENHNMKVGCSSCHNPHGGEGGRMLQEHSVNGLCYTCHAEKRGPFLWDHPPVREDCMNCHSPHGSNNPKLLTARAHLVCQQCHIHMLPRHSTTAGKPLDIWSINRGCLNCHGQIHGSNHPGGRTLTR